MYTSFSSVGVQFPRLTRRAILCFATLLAAITLSSCGGNGAGPRIDGNQAAQQPEMLNAPVDASRADPSVYRHIESSVAPADMPMIYDALAKIPEGYRSNLILVLADRTLSNRPEYLGHVVESAITPDTAATPDTTYSPFPTCSIATDPGRCSGAYRQHQSKPGGTYFQGSIAFSCSTTHLVSSPTTSAFLYVSNYAAGGSLDWEGGLEFDLPMGATGGSPVQVVPYIQEQHEAVDQLDSIGSPRLSCTQSAPVLIETWVAQKSTADMNPDAVLVLTGIFMTPPTNTGCSANANCVMTYMHPLENDPTSYSQECTSCSLFWTTSLAVKAGSASDEVPDTWFGVTGATSPTTAAPAITWANVETGTFSATGPNAVAATQPFAQKKILNVPATLPYLFLLKNASATGEVIGIDEYANFPASLNVTTH
jgi:hypothetical protein